MVAERRSPILRGAVHLDDENGVSPLGLMMIRAAQHSFRMRRYVDAMENLIVASTIDNSGLVGRTLVESILVWPGRQAAIRFPIEDLYLPLFRIPLTRFESFYGSHLPWGSLKGFLGEMRRMTTSRGGVYYRQLDYAPNVEDVTTEVAYFVRANSSHET